MAINPDSALEVLTEFRDLLRLNEQLHGQYGSAAAEGHESNQRLRELEPLVEKIAAAIEVDRNRHRPHGHMLMTAGMWWWSNRVGWVDRLIGILRNRTREDDVFTPAGPKLDAANLHRWVWHAATDLWDSGHYREAVQRAATAVEEQTRLKLESTEPSAADLYMNAFKSKTDPGDRRLRFVDLQAATVDGQKTPDWRSAHDGAAHFGRGCAQAIRNLATHRTDDLTEQIALEYLAALSVLARWVDTATLEVG
ncbi:MAG: hypothetical protein OXG91_09115 [bacterium]|nr:hypothetical protein [bacterium]